MTTARAIIRRGFREDNLIPIGRDPTDLELDEGLACLNGFILSAYGYELGENMEDWISPAPQRTAPVAANYPQLPYPLAGDVMVMPSPLASDLTQNLYPFPPPNSRIVWSGQAMTIWLPENPRPGSRIALVQGSGAFADPPIGSQLVLDGNGRRVESAPGVVSDTVAILSPAPPTAWFYRADLGVWVLVQELALDDECPFPLAYDDLWICALSVRLAPRYAKQVAQETRDNLARMLGKLKTEFRQVSPTVYKAEEVPRALESYVQGRWSW